MPASAAPPTLSHPRRRTMRRAALLLGMLLACQQAESQAQAQTPELLLPLPLAGRADAIRLPEAKDEKDLATLLTPISKLPVEAGARPAKTAASPITLDPSADAAALKAKMVEINPAPVEKMNAADYLEALRKVPKKELAYVFSTGSGKLTVTRAAEQAPLSFRRMSAKSLETLRSTLADAGWSSTATVRWVRQPGAEGTSQAALIGEVEITGPEVLLAELRRMRDPVTLALNLPPPKPASQRYPLRHPLTAFTKPVSLRAGDAGKKVPLDEAVAPLKDISTAAYSDKDGTAFKLQVVVPPEVGSTLVDFPALPAEWTAGPMTPSVYLGLLQTAGVTAEFQPEVDALTGAKKPVLKLDLVKNDKTVVLPESGRAGASAQATLLYLLRSSGLEADLQATVQAGTGALSLTGPPAVLDEALSLWQPLRSLTSDPTRLPLNRPMQAVENARVSVPALARASGDVAMTDAMTPLVGIDTGRTQKAHPTKPVETSVAISERANKLVARFDDQPPGLIRPAMSAAAYLRLLQENGLIFSYQNLADVAKLTVSLPAEAASVTFLYPGAAGYAHIVGSLRAAGWEADVSVLHTARFASGEVLPWTPGMPDAAGNPRVEGSERTTLKGPPELIAAIKSDLLDTGGTALKGPAATGDPTPAVITNDVVETWEFPLRYAQSETRRFQRVNGAETTDVPGVVELLTKAVANSKGTDDKKPAEEYLPGITAHPRRNAVLIMDFASRKPFYEALIQQLDQERFMIEMSIAVVDLSTDGGLSWGTELLLGRNHGDEASQDRSDLRLGSFAESGLNATSNVINSNNPSLLPGNFSSNLLEGRGFSVAGLIATSSSQLLGRISALEGQGKAHLLSRPTVMTLAGIEATFSDSTNVYVNVPGINLANTFEIPVMNKIKILPRVAVATPGRRTVQLVITLNDSVVSATEVRANGVQTPIVSSSTVVTHAEVGDNGSVVVGGRYRHIQNNVDANAPVLGKVPVLGLPFKKKALTDARTQRFYVISPRIVKVGSAAAAAVLPPQEHALLPPHLAPEIPTALPADDDNAGQGDGPGAAPVSVQPAKKGFFSRLFRR